jgi:hypothetical protein
MKARACQARRAKQGDDEPRTGGGRHEGNEQERANQRIEHGGLLCVSGLFTRLA